MKYKGLSYILTLFVCLAIGSCAKRPTKSPALSISDTTDTRQGTKIVPDELQGDSTDDNISQKSWKELAEEAEKSESYKQLKRNTETETVIDPGQFSALETQHVKISDYDPFRGKEYLFYDLSALESEFHYPCDGKLISNYGMRGRRMHTGVDLKANYGDNIYAAFDGVVRMAKYYSGYGNVVVIRHYNGLETVYGHNSKNKVKVNQVVKAGDIIALAGRTGRATTEHLHFEVRVQGQVFNPNLLIDVTNRKLQQKPLYVYKQGNSIFASNNERTASDRQLAATNDTPATAQASAVKSSIPAPKGGTTATDGNAVYHKIVKGDTLYALALKYKTTVAAICRLNGISSKKVLQLGERLRIK